MRNRLTGETVPSRPQDNRTRTYDDVGNLLSVSHAGDTWRDTAQTYDALNRVLSETSSGLTHPHTYDKANNRLTTTYDKSGRVLTRTYDPGNRLLTQEDVLSGEPTRLTSFAYDPQGNLLVKTLTDSSTENRTFDVRNRVTELHVKEPDGITTRLLQTYEYDLAGNLTALEESSTVGSLPTRVLTCAYDGTHRLIVEADQRGLAPAIVTNYTYDKADNRISREVFGGPDAGTTTYAIGNGGNGTGANQIASLTRPDTSVVAFTYDLTGARTSRTEDTRTDAYSYDVWNRLLMLDLQTPATPGDRGLYEYSYDARTRRVSRDELSSPTVLTFQGGVSIQEYAASPGTGVGGLPSPTVEYVRGPDQGGGVGGILYSVRSGAASLTHSSARGDVVAKVDESTSAMTWQAQYEAFGRRPEETGTNEDRQRANSKDEDPTGLLNEGFRYRDLETGTFVTRDPAGFVDGPNLYTYVRQNPWTKFDPEGLFWSALVTAGFAAYDTYQYARGNISGADYAGRMALNGAALLADAATGGMGGGVAIRTAALAARAGKAGQIAIKAAVAIDRAETAVSTAQAVISTAEAVEDGNYGRAAISAVQVAVTGKGMTKSAREAAEDTRKGVIALSEGRLSVGSSNSFDKGHREMADNLNLERVPSKRKHHGEENLMAAKDDLVAVGTYKRSPCGPSEHDCAGQLAAKEIRESPFLSLVAKKVNDAGLSEASRNRRTIAVGESAP